MQKNCLFYQEGNYYSIKSGIFQYIDGYKVEKESDEELDENKSFKYIENKSKVINYELFEKHFNFAALTNLAR